MYSRLLSAPKGKSFFLFGPRGTGKATWVRARFPGALHVDLLEARLFNTLTADPQRLSELDVRTEPETGRLFNNRGASGA